MGGRSTSAPFFAGTVIVLGLQPFSTEATYRLPLLYGVLPVRRRTVVASHYLISLLGLFGSLALMLGCVGSPGAKPLMLACSSEIDEQPLCQTSMP